MLINKSMLKNIIRNLIKNKKTLIFLVIINVVSFGMLFCNISYPKDMKNTIIKYYEEINAFDIYLSTDITFKKTDKDLIKELKMIKGVSLSKQLSVTATIKNKDYNIKALSITSNRNSNDNDYINKLTLSQGRYPSTINEGLLDEKLFKENNLTLGDLVILTLNDNDDLRAKKIKIVGTVKNSFYVDKENDNNYYIYLEENNFTNEYNEMYITILNNENYDIYSKDYKNLLNNKKEEIINIINPIIENRKNDSISYLNNELENKKETLNELNSSLDSLDSDIKNINEEINKLNNKIDILNKAELYSSVKISSTDFREYKNDVTSINKLLYIVSIIIFICFVFLNTFVICRLILKQKDEIISLKALGYNDFIINIKYISFILISHLIAFITLILLLKKIIPSILFYYYKKIYNISFVQPNVKIWPIITLLLVNIIFIILFSNIYFVYKKKKCVKNV